MNDDESQRFVDHKKKNERRNVNVSPDVRNGRSGGDAGTCAHYVKDE